MSYPCSNFTKPPLGHDSYEPRHEKTNFKGLRNYKHKVGLRLFNFI